MQDLNRDLTPDEADQQARFERRLTEALEAAPEIAPPEHFAAHIAALVPGRASLPRVQQAPRYARHGVIVSVVLLLLALFFFASRTSGSSPVSLTIQWLLCVQLPLLALFVVSRWSPWNSGD